MELRRLTAADAAAYRALRLRGLHEHPEAFTSSWEEDAARPLAVTESRLASPQQVLWGAFAGETLCGIVGLELLRRPKEQHKAKVVGMYVPGDAAGRGIGAALLQVLLAHARQAGLTDLVLTVTDGNAAAQRLYRKAGFQAFGTEPRAIRVDGRAFGKVHMHLALTPDDAP
ncbi:N-acetyltransferase family protein [Ramlibacter sp. MMS24-I3-19]|uniref:GNAT family N-acetyltransferase n=1 Tax=Ramlibacter sp. MMS24-I3-19 TaxID=3416606 RepID=UPI003CFFCC01